VILSAPMLATPAKANPALPGLIERYGDLRADHARAQRLGNPDQQRLERQASELFARITAMLRPAEPSAATDALAGLNLRAYHGDPTACTPYVVVDLHGVSVGVQRRACDLYVHVDTSETPDQVVAVEINGGGENDYATR
jgi:hypothetical protein